MNDRPFLKIYLYRHNLTYIILRIVVIVKLRHIMSYELLNALFDFIDLRMRWEQQTISKLKWSFQVFLSPIKMQKKTWHKPSPQSKWYSYS